MGVTNFYNGLFFGSPSTTKLKLNIQIFFKSTVFLNEFWIHRLANASSNCAHNCSVTSICRLSTSSPVNIAWKYGLHADSTTRWPKIRRCPTINTTSQSSRCLRSTLTASKVCRGCFSDTYESRAGDDDGPMPADDASYISIGVWPLVVAAHILAVLFNLNHCNSIHTICIQYILQ